MITKLIENLKKDKQLYYGWQANIAMAIYDAIRCIDGYKSKAKIHAACNKGANEFLKRLTTEANNE